jgi:hypothetical protein
VREQTNLMLDQIEALLGDDPRSVHEVERTLTDGYARALALEGERIRIERRIEGVAAGLTVGDSRRAEELSALADRRAKLDGDLVHLRSRLGLLKLKARELRAMLPQASSA